VLFGEAEAHPTVARSYRAGADPGDLTGRAQLVEHRRAICPHPRGQGIDVDGTA
jgi:hypothetical protein